MFTFPNSYCNTQNPPRIYRHVLEREYREILPVSKRSDLGREQLCGQKELLSISSISLRYEFIYCHNKGQFGRGKGVLWSQILLDSVEATL